MDFGVIEVANSKANAAPGWAYVPDVGVKNAVTALHPRKRARNQPVTLHDTTAKQDAKILRELAELDRENHRDVSIPIPTKPRDSGDRGTHKSTPAVRKIIGSQKTFMNHLDDFQVLKPTATTTSSQPASATPSTPAVAAETAALNAKRSHRKKEAAVSKTTPLRKGSKAATSTPVAELVKAEPSPDVSMPDAPPILSSGSGPGPAPHPGDSDILLVSRLPSLPSQAEIEKLLAAPPLSYTEARGSWTEHDRRKPVRQFCEVCGYWGRVRCMRCGGKVCALECLNVHQEECFTRYGA